MLYYIMCITLPKHCLQDGFRRCECVPMRLKDVLEHKNRPNRLSLAVFDGQVHFAMDWLLDLGGWMVSTMKIVMKTLAVGVGVIPYYGNYKLRANS